jgi:hypothetical protein
LLACILIAGCAGFLEQASADFEEQAAPIRFLKRSSDGSRLADLVRASGYEGEGPPGPWRLDPLR